MSTGTDQEVQAAAVAGSVWDILTRSFADTQILVSRQPFTNTIDIVYLGVPDRKFRITVEEVTE
jgi:hypothetical protein